MFLKLLNRTGYISIMIIITTHHQVVWYIYDIKVIFGVHDILWGYMSKLSHTWRLCMTYIWNICKYYIYEYDVFIWCIIYDVNSTYICSIWRTCEYLAHICTHLATRLSHNHNWGRHYNKEVLIFIVIFSNFTLRIAFKKNNPFPL